MKKQKYFYLLFYSLYFLIILVLLSIIFSQTKFSVSNLIDDSITITKPNHSVILMIGDGMGFNHLEVTKTYFHQDKLNMETLPFQGKVKTYSLNLPTPTDSAAAATAIATGKKVYNYEIAQTNGQDLPTITEYAKLLNKGVGIICTSSFYDATPAAFSSHTAKRSNTSEIIEDQISSNIDLFIGAGFSTYNDYLEKITKAGYSFIKSYQDLSLADTKIMATFDNIVDNTYPNTSPSLGDVTNFALKFMEAKFPQGFFLLIEGSHIDKKCHNLNLLGMIEALQEFDKSVAIANTYCEKHIDTSLIICADHETGGLNYHNESFDYLTISGKTLFSNAGHTNRYVPYFIKAPIKRIPYYIDNTDLFIIIKSLLIV